MGATKFRARFDPVVTFSNGGGLRAGGFRVDVPGPDVTEPDAASLFIASLNLRRNLQSGRAGTDPPGSALPCRSADLARRL